MNFDMNMSRMYFKKGYKFENAKIKNCACRVALAVKMDTFTATN